MRRRDLITLIGGAAAWPAVARAQQTTGRVAHIGYLGVLGPSTLDPRQIEGFKEGLRENGLIEGRNITVDYLWAEGSQDRLRQLAETDPFRSASAGTPFCMKSPRLSGMLK
jgi:putative ABC transport system substrate-binding protein